MGREQCREPKRRNPAFLKWKIYRRRSVTADDYEVRCWASGDCHFLEFFSGHGFFSDWATSRESNFVEQQ
jgi:hypothetical protein